MLISHFIISKTAKLDAVGHAAKFQNLLINGGLDAELAAAVDHAKKIEGAPAGKAWPVRDTSTVIFFI
jgi:hypothetical protein